MINAFSSLQNYDGDDWSSYLDKICLYHIFEELFTLYPDTNTLKCVIKYIVWAYSIQSDKIILGMDWHHNKEQIFEKANVIPNRVLYDDLVNLQKPEVVSTINKWLNFQEEDTFKQVSMLKDLRMEMQISSLNIIRKSNGENDFDQKFKNAKYAIELKQMIKDLESELVQNNVILKEAAREIKMSVKKKDTFGVESFAK